MVGKCWGKSDADDMDVQREEGEGLVGIIQKIDTAGARDTRFLTYYETKSAR